MADSLTGTKNFTGKINYTVTGGTLRSNPDDINACSLNSSSTASLSHLPSGATVQKAYLYWAGSGENIDSQITFDGTSLTADKTYTSSIFVSDPNYGDDEYYHFQGVKDVTNIIAQKGNGSYQFSDLAVDNTNNYSYYCDFQGVLSGWSLVVIYEDPTLENNKINTIKLYEGLKSSRNQTIDYTLNGIQVATDPIAKFSMLLWEGDSSLSGVNESFAFNGNTLSDTYNPLENQFNSSINTSQASNIYGVDFDTFDVSDYVNQGDTSVTGTISTGDDLVLQGAALVMVTTIYNPD
ncbi:hypothetical protein I4641_06265 [Waterburya agarophytonicola K14]|uniref:Uncharacterized protein n=1 Tax=Waterburya agarophytonicola KI4 TaxID=2874699 RepID=A0A964BR22_9CYAN|nr:DUF3344 domain-containing protein [Waterburya agarophytonicola]MCC0176581.1 hypothetical protein [Waterburya agarophytonicola KI4]